MNVHIYLPPFVSNKSTVVGGSDVTNDNSVVMVESFVVVVVEDITKNE